jgi:putative tricarboxylic transport membrane protein
MMRDRISGIVFILIGAGVFIASLNYPVGTLPKPGGGFFPLLAAALLLVLSVVFTFESFTRRAEPGHVPPFFPARETPRRILFGAAALVAYRYLIPLIGFALSTGLFILLLGRFLENFSWKRSLLFAVLTAVASYYLFQVVLKIQMPVPLLRF